MSNTNTQNKAIESRTYIEGYIEGLVFSCCTDCGNFMDINDLKETIEYIIEEHLPYSSYHEIEQIIIKQLKAIGTYEN